MRALLMISFSFLYVPATTALVLPQPHLPLPHYAVAAPQNVAHQSTRQENRRADIHTSMRAWKRTDSIGVGGPASVYVCEHVFWGGRCEIKTYNLGTDECVMLDGSASSIRPDPGFSCVFYKNAVCRDFSDGTASITLESPGNDNLLATEKGDFNDKIHAFQCYMED